MTPSKHCIQKRSPVLYISSYSTGYETSGGYKYETIRSAFSLNEERALGNITLGITDMEPHKKYQKGIINMWSSRQLGDSFHRLITQTKNTRSRRIILFEKCQKMGTPVWLMSFQNTPVHSLFSSPQNECPVTKVVRPHGVMRGDLHWLLAIHFNLYF